MFIWLNLATTELPTIVITSPPVASCTCNPAGTISDTSTFVALEVPSFLTSM